MLVISPDSLNALSQAQAAQARCRLCLWLEHSAPRFGMDRPSPQRAEQAVDLALGLCLPNGIRREGDIARIALRALRHGPSIRDGAHCAYIRTALAAEEVDPDRRVTLVKLIELGLKPPTGPWHV